MQHWFCNTCKAVETVTKHTTMIYHKHDTALVILSPMTTSMHDAYVAEHSEHSDTPQTKVPTVKKKIGKQHRRTLGIPLSNNDDIRGDTRKWYNTDIQKLPM